MKLKEEMARLKKQNEDILRRDEMVIENDKKMKELVNEEHNQVKQLADVVDEMKRHDKELENELQKYKAMVEDNKSIINKVAADTLKAEREAVKKKLELMKDIFQGSNENTMKVVLEKLGSGANEEVKSLVDAALSKIDEAQKTREKSKAKWFQLRRLSLPSLHKKMEAHKKQSQSRSSKLTAILEENMSKIPASVNTVSRKVKNLPTFRM